MKIYKHLSNSFCQGICFDGENIIESSGLYNRSYLAKYSLIGSNMISPIKILSQINLNPKYFAEGICTIPENKDIYQLTWKENKLFIYDINNLSLKQTLYYPYEGWGLTYNSDKRQLISSDGTKTLRYIDPNTLKINAIYQSPISQINELEWVKDYYILANVFTQNLILTLDERMNNRILKKTKLPDNIITKEQTAPNNVLNGIAYHQQRNKVYLTGKLWKNIYELDINEFYL